MLNLRGESKEDRCIKELKKDAATGSGMALKQLWRMGYMVITIGGKRINLRERFGDPKSEVVIFED